MIRPVDIAPSQLYGDNPTSIIYPGHPDYWIILKYGNYQPDGHAGQDYPCRAGTLVRAVTSGTVLHVGWLKGTYADNPWWIAPAFAGYTYVVDHGSFIGIYGHCLDGGSKVSVGQRVSEGQTLGPSGNTGASTGDHLHFEILPDGYNLNARMYGRIDPETLFGGIQLQSATITPIPSQEDDLTPEQDLKLTRLLEINEENEKQNIRNIILAMDQRSADAIGALKDIQSKLADIDWSDDKKTSLRQQLADIQTSANAILEELQKDAA